MKFKAILAVVLVLSILSILFYENKMSSFKLPSLNSLNLPTGLEIFPFGSEKISNVEIETLQMPYQPFSLLNNTVKITGICLSPIYLGETEIDMTSQPCQLTLYNPQGKIYLRGKEVKIDATFSKAFINSLQFKSKESIKVEILPRGLIVPVETSELKMSSFKGKLRRLTPNGNVISEINFPPCKDLHSGRFLGTVRLINNTFVLKGVATGLKYRCE